MTPLAAIPLFLALLSVPPDWPLLAHGPFPSERECAHWIRLNRDYRKQVVWRQGFETQNYSYWQVVIGETDALWLIWDRCSDGQCRHRGQSYRLECLRDLLERIGPEAYFTGVLPPAVPVWRLPIIE